jgi:glyoxylase-like metal-dependent hydrolase (beta-lactamase superfamily II)
MITVKTFVEGPVDANNYLLVDEESKEAVLIDCSSSREEFINAIKETNCKLKYILLTHGHFDHILGIEKFKETFNIDVYVSQDDLNQMDFAPQMLEMFMGSFGQKISIPETKPVKDSDEFKIGNYIIKAISTPGHTKGGMCYLVDNKLFSGDTLFQGSVGRCDLLDGDLDAIIKSVKEKLFILPDDIEVYTGHGGKTSIGFEKKYNEIIDI